MAGTLVTITHTYANEDGTPASGTVSFLLSEALHFDTTTIVPVRKTVTLDNAGAISVVLTATTNADNPGVVYEVVERVHGLPNGAVRTYVDVPHNQGSALDLYTLNYYKGPSGGALSQLSDYDATSRQHGYVLYWNETDGKVEHKVETGSGGGAAVEPTTAPPTVSTTGNVLGTSVNAAHADHTHALPSHAHSSTATGGTLVQSNTHGSPDTDSAPTALHHTLGAGANQAAAGNHTHATSAITSGTFSAARLGSGTPDTTTYLRGDGTWVTPPGGVALETTSAPPATNTTASALGTVGTAAHSDHTHALGLHTHVDAANGGALNQSATHGSADTDTATSALHHTLGTGANQAAAGNHTHVASAITSGTLAPARVGTGTPDGTKYLRDDGAWASVPGGVNLESTTAPPATGSAALGTSGTAAHSDHTHAIGTHAHAGTDITSGLIPTARLGAGAATSTTYLRGDQTWATVSAGQGGTIGWVSVKDYGAVGDGSTDDTAAIKAAISSMNSTTSAAMLYFPSGTYAITSTLFFPTEANLTKLGVFFDPAATVKTHSSKASTWGTNQALLQVLTSDADIWNPTIQGTGSTTNPKLGCGIRFGTGPMYTSLTGALTAAATTITVNSATALGIANGDYITVVRNSDGLVETMKVTAGAGTTSMTVSRGQRQAGLYAFSGTKTIVGNGTTATVSGFTASTIGVAAGDSVTIAGASPSGFNGTYTVASLTSTGFTFANTTVGTSTSGTYTYTRTFSTGDYVQVGFWHPAKGDNNSSSESYRCNVWSPTLSQLTTGIEWSIDEQPGSLGGSGNSCGDHHLWGGYIGNCVTGILNRGFVNRVDGTTVANCTVGVDGGGANYSNSGPSPAASVTVRNSHKIMLANMTINQSSDCAVWIRAGDGSSISGEYWSENTSTAHVDLIRVGQTVALGGVATTAYNTIATGTMTLTAQTGSTSAVRLLNAIGTDIQAVRMSTNGGKPSAVVVGDASLTTNSRNRVRQIAAHPGSGNKAKMSDGSSLPAPWVNNSTAVNSIIVEAHYETDTNATAGTLIGLGSEPHHGATYTMFKSTANGVTTYFAKNRHGHIHAYGTDTGTTSGLIDVLGSIIPPDTMDTGIHLHFSKGRFHFIDAPLGTEAWAVSETCYPLVRAHNLRISGEGIGATIWSNRTNALTGSDTEIVDATMCYGLTVEDITIESCGQPKTTTDAVDLDDVTNGIFRRVEIRHSRAKAITCDGGYNGQYSGSNIFTDLMIRGRPDAPILDNSGSAQASPNGNSGAGLTAALPYSYATTWVLQDAGVFFGSGVSGFSGDARTNTLTAATYSAGTLTFTVSAVPLPVQHANGVGMQLNVSGMTPSGYNGTWRISAATSTTVTVDRAYGSASANSIADPGSAGTVTNAYVIMPDETKPSDPTVYVPYTGNLFTKVHLRPGPYNCVAQRIYRYDATAAAWKLAGQTVTNALGSGPGGLTNTGLPLGLAWIDGQPSASLTGSVPSWNTAQKSSIPDMGVEIMAARRCIIKHNIIDGTGDTVNGANQIGIYLVRKNASVTGLGTNLQWGADENVVVGNIVRQTGGNSFKISGGSDNIVSDNQFSNPGVPGTKAQAVRIEHIAASGGNLATVNDRNSIQENRIKDNGAQVQTGANGQMWQGGVGMSNALSITNAAITNTVFTGNIISDTSATVVSDSGTGTNATRNNGWTTEAGGNISFTGNGAATSFTVTHGLSTTPTNVQLTETTDPNGRKWWISAKGATTFTVSIAQSTGAAIPNAEVHSFDWRAVVGAGN